jgi:phosphohistidine phosphatase
MDIILWRHAEAEDVNTKESGDLARRLTAKGQEQAEQMAKWLRRHLPSQIDIKVSPARRCVETAEALGAHYDLSPAIAPDTDVREHLKVIEGAHRAKRSAVLLVGHQPTLGILAATLMTGHGAPWAIKKGAVWWLRSGSPSIMQSDLLLALPPRLLPL